MMSDAEAYAGLYGTESDEVAKLKQNLIDLHKRVAELEDMLEALGRAPYAAGTPLSEWALSPHRIRAMHYANVNMLYP